MYSYTVPDVPPEPRDRISPRKRARGVQMDENLDWWLRRDLPGHKQNSRPGIDPNLVATPKIAL